MAHTNVMDHASLLRAPLVGEEIHRIEIPGGPELFVCPKSGYSKKYAVFATRYGSIDNEFVPLGKTEPVKVPDGIAHFLEHKLFDKEWGNVFDKFAELGASANAYTGNTMTAYLFSCTENFDEALTLLVDFVLSPYFSDATVEKEKGIIEQEIRMYEDDPDRLIISNALQAIYSAHPVRIEIGGTVESIRKIDKDLLYLCYETFYDPSNMAIFVAGDVSPEKTAEVVFEALPDKFRRRREAVSPDGHAGGGEITRIYPKEPEQVRERRVEAKRSVSLPKYCLGFKEIPGAGGDGRELLRRDIATGLILDAVLGKSSALFNDLYEEGLVDDEFSSYYAAALNYGHILIGGDTKDPELLDKKLRDGIARVRESGIPEQDFERLKRKIYGSFISAFNSLEFIANGFLSHHFKNHSLLDYPEVLNEMTLEDLNRRLKQILDPEKSVVSLVLPG